MAYGLIYQGEFSSTAENDYRLEILRKDYTGLFYTLPLAAVPVVQNWGTDEIKDTVKGSNLSINYLNINDVNPIENFYSNNDDEFKVIFYQGSTVLFTGFLVQDDFIETLVDFTHEVQLSANDGLGLLKDIALNKNPVTVGAYSNATTAEGEWIPITVPPQNWIYLRNTGNFVPVVGVPFILNFHTSPPMNTAFTPTVVNNVGAGNYNVRTNIYTGQCPAAPVSINGLFAPFNFYGRNSLLSVIAICLQNTGLQLETYVYDNLFEDSFVTNKSPLDQTVIDLQTFISGETFESCYSVLDKICKRFHLSIFQSLGRWNIIRWDELRLNPAINAFVYDSNFYLTGTAVLPTGMVFGFQEDTEPETGLARQGVRPYQFVKETFNYTPPKYLLANYDLRKLGTLVRTNTAFGKKYDEYNAAGFENGDVPPHGELLITVVTEVSTQTELDRYLVVKYPQGFNARAARSPAIDIKAGDKAKISMLMRLNFQQSLPYTTLFSFKITDGTSIRYICNTVPSPGVISWNAVYGYEFGTPPNTPATSWQEVSVEFPPFPFDGILYIHYPLATNALSNQPIGTWFKDMRIEYTSYINESTKIIGHIHNDSQDLIIKNNQDSEIFMDDSPRNALAGTLFLTSFAGTSQIRTSLWHRSGVTESLKLGEITTREELQWRSNVRTRLQGSYRGLIQLSQHISMLNWFTYAQLTGLNFLFGNLQIDFRNDKITCSATEIFKDGEPDVTDTYTFKYIYDAK